MSWLHEEKYDCRNIGIMLGYKFSFLKIVSSDQNLYYFINENPYRKFENPFNPRQWILIIERELEQEEQGEDNFIEKEIFSPPPLEIPGRASSTRLCEDKKRWIIIRLESSSSPTGYWRRPLTFRRPP